MRLLLPLLASLACLNVQAQKTWVVQVGTTTPAMPVDPTVHTMNKGPQYEWTFMKFYPDTLTINVGDMISFQQTAGQLDTFHTINFNPLVPGPDGSMTPFYPVGIPPPEAPGNAFPPKSQIFLTPQLGNMGTGVGVQNQRFTHTGYNTTYIASGFFVAIPFVNPDWASYPPSFNITFQAVGSFMGYCAAHSPDMTFNVNVLPAGSPVPQTPEQVIGMAQGLMAYDQNSAKWRDRHIGRGADNWLIPVPSSEFPSGFQPQGNQWMVRVGTELEGASTPRFIPERIEISAGDVLHFYAEDNDIHTVTIHAESYDISQKDTTIGANMTILKDWPSTPGNITNPYPFNGYAHSGIMLNEALETVPGLFPPFWLKSPFSVRFNNPGNFHIMCLIHKDLGMEGMIFVKPTASCAPQQASTVNINFAGMFGGK